MSDLTLGFNCCCAESPPVTCLDLCDWSVNRRAKITAGAGTAAGACMDAPPFYCCGSAHSAATYFCDFFAAVGDSTNPFWTLIGGCWVNPSTGPATTDLCSWQGPSAVDNLQWWVGVGFDGTNYIAAIVVNGGGGGALASYLYTTTTLSDICNGGLVVPLCSNYSTTCTLPVSVILDWVP